MINDLKKLISIGSKPICNKKLRLYKMEQMVKENTCFQQLELVLQQKNGFYAFESALHIFPSGCNSSIITLEKWNDINLWKKDFEGNIDQIIFFAEDLFGGQFGIREGEIIKFEPETCEIDSFAKDLEEWSSKILNDYDYETGYTLATKWQEQNRPLQEGERLVPKIPFVLGGEYKVENLYAIEAVEGMRFRSDLWKQIKNLPDGEEVEIRIT